MRRKGFAKGDGDQIKASQVYYSWRAVWFALFCCGSPRRLLAILEFQQCLRIEPDVFERFFPLHQVSAEEFAQFQEKWSAGQGCCYGWQVSLIHAFLTPPVVALTAGEIWITFRPADLEPASLSKPFFRPVESSSSLEVDGLPSGDGSYPKASQSDTFGETQGQQDVEEETDDQNNIENEASSEQVPCILCAQTERELTAVKQRCGFILRPFSSSWTDLTVVVRLDEGRMVVGSIEISCQCVSSRSEIDSLVDQSAGIYSKTQAKAMKSNKCTWIWTIKSISVFDSPSQIRFLDLAPRFKNRPFLMKRADLSLTHVNRGPKAMNLEETARFLYEHAPSEMREGILHVLESLRTKTIRIGTTCSGIDICVNVLQDTEQYFNKLKAGCSKQKLECPWSSCCGAVFFHIYYPRLKLPSLIAFIYIDRSILWQILF